MNFKLLTLLPVFFFILNLSAQTKLNQSFSVGFEANSQYYIDDDVTGPFEEDDPFRSNSYLNLGYKLNNFTFGLQLEGYAPQALLNYSPKYDQPVNIGTFSVAYSKDKWGITLGHFYEQFGSGMILRSWEDRQLGINNAIRGAKFSFQPTDRIDLTALYGQQRVGFTVSEGQIFGFDSNFDLSSEENTLQLGLSYVGRYQEVEDHLEPVVENLDPITHALSGRVQFAKNGFYTNLEGVVKSKDALIEAGVQYNDKQFFGNSFQVEMGYSQKGFGVVSTLRRMENMSFFSDRLAAGNLYNEQIMNYIPGLTKLHDYSLANIYVYQAQPSISFNPSNSKVGEIGGQIDVYYKFKKETPLGGKYGTKLAFNFSNWYGLDADYNTEYKRLSVSPLGTGEQYFRDFNIEIRKKINKKMALILVYINSFYNKTYVEERAGEIYSNVAVVDMTYKFSRKQSVRLDAQHIWTEQDKKNWAASTMEFNINSHFSVFASDMYNYGNEEVSHRSHYYNLGGSYTKNSSRFALSYGRQRGGLLCVGGVCREVPAATGLTFNVTTSF